MFSIRARGGLLAAVFVCLTSLDAAAQVVMEPPPTSMYLRWGPIWARPAVKLNAGFNNNVFRSGDGQGDFTATIAPQLNGLVLFDETAYMTFLVNFRYTAYQTFTELNYWDVLSRAQVNFPMGRIGLFAGLRYDRVRRSPIDLDGIRPVQQVEQFDVGANFKLGPRSSIRYTFGLLDFTYFDDDFGNAPVDIAQIQDRVERWHILEFRSRVFARTTFHLTGETTLAEFDTPRLPDSELSRDSRISKLLPGFTLGDYGSLVGTLQVGWAHLNYEEEGIQDDSGLVGEANIIYKPFERTSLRWDAWRRVGYSLTASVNPTAPNNLYVNETTRLGLVHSFTRIVAIDTRVGLGRLEIPANRREDDLFTIHVGLRLQSSSNSMGRRTEYSITFDRFRRESSTPVLNRTFNTLGFNAHFGY